MNMRSEPSQLNGNEIAVIGMAGRFPGAANLEEFWQRLYDGVEAVTFFSREELLAAGIPAATLDDPHYVRANVVLEDSDLFDASFFGYSPHEAALLDPQQRLFLECAWQAIEHAGYNPQIYSGPIGVYASMSSSTYLLYNLLRNRHVVETTSMQQLLYGNEKDFLATRVAYKLGLQGPAMTIQTACSSSLVAIHVACQSLLSGECDIALAGGVCVNAQPRRGHIYQREGYYSPDGHCRAFDARAEGTIGGSGLGVIVLKRLEEALEQRDSIHAVIKGTACNNDGARKVGYAAPSIQGQAAVIREALTVADVAPDTIDYIETHGTGTQIGDPIEIAALSQAYEAYTTKKSFCAIGSIKTNMGHMDAAAGVAGMLKTVLSLKHGCLPMHLHFEQPNPQIDFSQSPFYVNSERRPWLRNGRPRRAAVSAFGIGGTNAHIILEEAPEKSVFSSDPALTDKEHTWHLLPLSAQSTTALATQQQQLASYLKQNTELAPGDIAYTLQVGRRAFSQRCFMVCDTTEDAVHALEGYDAHHLFSATAANHSTSVAFMFPGGGTQYMNMGRDLYEQEPFFREQVNHCVSLVQPYLQYEPLSLLYPTPEQEQTVKDLFQQDFISLPILFIVEYALAKLLLHAGITPQAMIGHSLGEYVCACLSGVFTLEDALAVVARREKLSASISQGAMLSVLLSEQELQPFMNEQLSLAAINTPLQCVVSGMLPAIEQLEHVLREHDVACRRLHVAAAGHSALLEPILGQLARLLQTIPLRPPRIPFISNLTGTWITPEEATSPEYWVKHLRHTVRFSAGIQELLQGPERLLLEVGPGQSLSLAVKNILAGLRTRNPQLSQQTKVLATMRQAQEPASDHKYLLTALGHVWLAGHFIEWEALHAHQQRSRIPLPTYPFEHRQRYWIEPDRESLSGSTPRTPRAAEAESAHEPVLLADGQQTGVENAAQPVAALSTSFVAPRNENEQTIAIIWQEVLGVDQVGVEDNFFELGGDSLISLKLSARLHEAFSLDLPLRLILENPTIAQQAVAIDLLFIEEIEHLSDDEVKLLLARELPADE